MRPSIIFCTSAELAKLYKTLVGKPQSIKMAAGAAPNVERRRLQLIIVLKSSGKSTLEPQTRLSIEHIYFSEIASGGAPANFKRKTATTLRVCCASRFDA